LHDAFSGRVGINGEVLLDPHLDSEDSESSAAEHGSGGAVVTPSDEPTTTVSRSKASPIENLAGAMQAGMEAIAASLTASNSPDNTVSSLVATLQRQHEETRQFQTLQLQLLQQLIAKVKA
jgi:hypothetical protein